VEEENDACDHDNRKTIYWRRRGKYMRYADATKEQLIECLEHINMLAYEEVYDEVRANDILLAIHETTNNVRPISIVGEEE